MDEKSQYHIPQSREASHQEVIRAASETPLNEALRIADSFQYSPEKQPGPYQLIKDIENAVFSFRDTQIAMELAAEQSSSIPGASFFRRSKKRTANQIEAALTNQEWKIGGNLYGKDKGYLFGLEARNFEETPNHPSKQPGWFHFTPDPKNPAVGTVVHFDVDPYKLTMSLSDGRPYAPSIQDIERLVSGGYYYLQHIRDMYPLDATLAELVEDISHDYQTKKDDYRLAA